MRRTEALQGVRVAMFLNIKRRWESAELNEEEAAELLGVSERTFRRWRNRCDERGEAGLLDQRLGKAIDGFGFIGLTKVLLRTNVTEIVAIDRRLSPALRADSIKARHALG